MNDAHVVVLVYRIGHEMQTDDRNAQLLDLEEPTFPLRINPREARL